MPRPSSHTDRPPPSDDTVSRVAWPSSNGGFRGSRVRGGAGRGNRVRGAAGRGNPGTRRRRRAVDAPARDRAIALGKWFAETAPDPLPVARTVQRIIESRSPHLRYPVGLDAQLAPRLVRLLPETLLVRVGSWALMTDNWRRDLLRGGLLAVLTLVAAGIGWRARARRR